MVENGARGLQLRASSGYVRILHRRSPIGVSARPRFELALFDRCHRKPIPFIPAGPVAASFS
jgi:hypothetical protein